VLNDTSVGAAYDAVAEHYTTLYADQIRADATERWIIDQFGQLCREAGNELIADLGCGPGRLSAFLTEAGNHILGVDVSAEMIRIARRRSPHLSFQREDMTAFLTARPDSVGNAVFWYSTIHLAPDELPALMRTTFRAVRVGGHVLLGFLSTADPAAAIEPYDHRVVPAYRYSLAEIHRLLIEAGFRVQHLGLRAPALHERAHAGYALARKPPIS
jgi:SAM-dependent methyltransferase